MTEPTRLYELWQQAESFSCRPSDLLSIECTIEAYYLDRACWLYGSKLDAEIKGATSKAKSEKAAAAKASQILHRRLNANGEKTSSKSKKGHYKDPALM